MRKIILCAALILSVNPAFALNDTIGVTAGAGKTANLIKFGSNNVISEVGICDATTENQCAGVNASGQVAVAVANGANVVLGSLNDAGTCATGNTEIACLRQIDTDVKAPAAISTWAGGTLGSMANYGTSPGAVLVPGVNSFMTSGNLTQFGGTNLATGTGAGGAGIPRVTMSNDSTLAANQSVNVNQVGGTTPVLDPCQANTPTIKPITITTNTTTNIITGTSAKKVYICYLYFQNVAADNIAVISGTTGATCGANTAALVGGTTAANGLNNAANSGQAFGNGGFSVMQVLTNNDDVCIITSAATPLAGLVKYVVQ